MINQFQQPKIPKLTKALAEQIIASSLGFYPQQLKYVKLPESSRDWKHACVPTGVIKLFPQTIQYGMSTIEFTFCQACGKVHYFYEDANMY